MAPPRSIYQIDPSPQPAGYTSFLYFRILRFFGQAVLSHGRSRKILRVTSAQNGRRGTLRGALSSLFSPFFENSRKNGRAGRRDTRPGLVRCCRPALLFDTFPSTSPHQAWARGPSKRLCSCARLASRSCEMLTGQAPPPLPPTPGCSPGCSTEEPPPLVASMDGGTPCPLEDIAVVGEPESPPL